MPAPRSRSPRRPRGPPSCSAVGDLVGEVRARAPPRRPSGGVAAPSSRARRATRTVPCVSPRTCTSTWRPCSTYGSTKTVPSPKAEAASRLGLARSRGRSSRSRTTRMPRPPPPAEAFTSSGRSASVGSSGAVEDGYAGGAPSAAWRGSWSPSPRWTRVRADPGQAGVEDGPGEVGVLGEEAVAGVHRVGARRRGGLEHEVGAQVGLGRACCRAAVRPRRPRARRAAASASEWTATVWMPSRRQVREDPAGDLAAVGDQER